MNSSSPQVLHAIECQRKLQAAQFRLDQANKALNNALVRMSDTDMIEFYLAMNA
jgi:hypothetical protein